jgi:AraC family transcriptional activator of tynA and feaB
MSFARDRQIIARATDDELLICLQLCGTMAIEQNGREVLLEAGDFTIIDPFLPYAGAFPNASNS